MDQLGRDVATGDLIVNLNLDQKTVEVSGSRVHLTGKEYQMLELLSLRKGTTLTKEMFLNHLYGGMDEPELKIIDVFICKLRKKLANASQGRNYIETVWGRGYVLREPTEEDTCANRLKLGTPFGCRLQADGGRKIARRQLSRRVRERRRKRGAFFGRYLEVVPTSRLV